MIKDKLVSPDGLSFPALYVEVKKRAKCETASIFKKTEKKYFTRKDDRLVLIQHLKFDKRQFVTVSDEFFKELLSAWCVQNGILIEDFVEEHV